MRGKEEMNVSEEVAKATPPPVLTLQVERLKEEEEGRKKSHSIISVDFETAISKSGYGKFNWAMLLLALPASCTSGFVSGSMSFVIPAAAEDLNLTPTSKALLQSVAYIGMISSGFIWGFASDTFGRKKLIVAGFLLDFLMNFLTGISPSLPLILVFKFLSGFMVSGPFSIFSTYMSEVFLSKQRDQAVLSVGVFGSIGNIVQSALAMWIIPAEVPFQLPLKSWQLFIIACGMPSLICGLGFLCCVESPKFLVAHGDHEKALKICRKIYSINTGRKPSTYPVKRLRHDISISEEKKKPMSTKVLESIAIFRPPYIKRAALSFMIQFGVVAGVNTLRLWLPEMLMLVKSSKLDSSLGLCPLLVESNEARSNSSVLPVENNSVYMQILIANAGGILGHLLFILVVNNFGKKNMLILCCIVSAVCVSIIPSLNADYVYIPASIFLTVLSVGFFSNISIVVSVFPTKVRATSVSMTLATGRVGILVVNFLIVHVIYSSCEYFFYSMALLSLVMTGLSLCVSVEPIKEPSRIQN